MYDYNFILVYGRTSESSEILVVHWVCGMDRGGGSVCDLARLVMRDYS